MRITRRELRQLIFEMTKKRKPRKKAKPKVSASLAALPKVTSDVGVILTKEDYNANKRKMDSFGLQVARFNHSKPVPIYRIVDANEFNIHIPKAGGIISGGSFQPGEEGAFGASFGFDPVQLILDFAKGPRPHLKGKNYLIHIPDANGLLFANMELTYDKGGFRSDFGLSGGSTNSPYRSSIGSRLKTGISLPHNFTIPPDLCHGVLGCQMVVDTTAVGALFYEIDAAGNVTLIN